MYKINNNNNNNEALSKYEYDLEVLELIQSNICELNDMLTRGENSYLPL